LCKIDVYFKFHFAPLHCAAENHTAQKYDIAFFFLSHHRKKKKKKTENWTEHESCYQRKEKKKKKGKGI
jgi:hypothetical protein